MRGAREEERGRKREADRHGGRENQRARVERGAADAREARRVHGLHYGRNY